MNNNNDNEKIRPRLLGDYLPCSDGAVRIAMKKKREMSLRGKPPKHIGEILLELNMISKEDLANALRKQRADRLSFCPVFASLNRIELTAISNYFSEISLPSKKQFIFECEHDPSLYVLVDGRAEVFTHDDDGNEVHISYITSFSLIGEMGYLQGGIRTASVRTIDPSELLWIEYKNLTHCFEHAPHIAHAFMDAIKHR